MFTQMKKAFRIIAVVSIGIFVIAAMTTCGNPDHDEEPTVLETAVDLTTVKSHQVMLQEIANQNGNTRAAGTPGHDQSVEYIAAQLELAGYQPAIQEFDFHRFAEASDPVLNLVSPSFISYQPNVPEGFMTMQYSGSGNVTAVVRPVDLIIPMDPLAPPSTSTSGCEPEDFAGFVPGSIALLQRGTCSFDEKVTNAQNALAVGVIFMNEGQLDRTDASHGALSEQIAAIPAVFANYNIGVELYSLIQNNATVSVNLKVDAVVQSFKSYNVIADTPGGDDTSTVVVGAHLDSVSEGPGINDNGSGSAAILEVASKIGLLNIEPKHKIRFAFWSAEEEGLIGSEYYVAHLTPEELGKISMYLNFDMIASPNYIRFVYDGDSSDFPGLGPSGSEEIEELLNDYFANKGLPTDPTAIDGSSDYGSFATRNIPVGGLYSGSGEIKTEEQVKKYGGTAGEACDSNYHTPNDTVDNLNYTIEEQMLKAIAYVVSTCGDAPVSSTEKRQKEYQSSYQPTYKGPLAIR